MKEDQEQIERLTGIIHSYLNGKANGFGDKSMSPKLYSTREDASKFKPFSENSDQKENAKKFINNEEETIMNLNNIVNTFGR